MRNNTILNSQLDKLKKISSRGQGLKWNYTMQEYISEELIA